MDRHTDRYPDDVHEIHGKIIRAAHELERLIGGTELAQITEATNGTEIPATIVRIKAGVQELNARNQRKTE